VVDAVEREEPVMSTLIAIGYPDETTASSAAEEAHRMARDLTIEPEAIAVISRDRGGRFRVCTNHHPVGGGASWGMFWGLLFGFLFFVPVLGMAVGAGLGAVFGRITKSGIDRQFRNQVRDMLEPGTSALFLVVDRVAPDRAVEGLRRFGGTVLKSSLTKQDEQELQEVLYDRPVPASAS
jgi:uncharacterized membrane protein